MPLSAWPHPFVIAVAAVVGSMLGSFFNVVIYRVPRGESIVFPASRCPQCGHRIRPWENLPVLSWLWLRGRCSQCRARISAQYPLVEAATGLWAALLVGDLLRHPQPPGSAAAYLYFALCALPITLVDLRHYLIPDALTLPGILIAFALAFLPGGLTPWQALAGGFCAGLALWAVGAVSTRLLKKEAMGFGDVKLLALAGACFGWKAALLGLGVASVLGTLVGLPLLLARRLNAERHIPFGPFLCAGVLLAARFSGPLVNWYLHFGLP